MILQFTLEINVRDSHILLPLSGTTHLREETFSAVTAIKSKHRDRLQPHGHAVTGVCSAPNSES